MDQKEWFASWFDTDYYHILYKHRDKKEAARFVKNLCEALEIPKGAEVLDLACGMGRHSVTLNKLGYRVTGADLSDNSIAQARAISGNDVQFIVHDMREVIPNRSFDVVFNLFTSFGYFDTEQDNLKVLEAVNQMLAPNGLLVIDFLNARKVIQTLNSNSVISRSGIDFHISKKFDGTHILKQIDFEDQGNRFHYEERVQALTFDDFQSLLDQSQFDILRTFGDLELNAFDASHSDRLILVAKKR